MGLLLTGDNVKSKLKACIVIFFVLGMGPLSIVFGQGYGEDSQALGQFTDDFENTIYVSVQDDTVQNSTFDVMQLATGISSPIYENFTAYTEVDVDGDITITLNKIDWDTMRRDADSYVYYDFGAGSWSGDFEFNYELNITDLEAGDATSATVLALATLANTSQSMDEMRTAGNPYLALVVSQVASTDNIYSIYLWEYNGANVIVQRLENAGVDYEFQDDTEYYIKFNRTGNVVSGWAYSDQAMTTLLANYTATGNGDSYRYLHGICNWGRNVDPADHLTGYLENLDIGNVTTGYESDGYFTTTNYLSDPLANGSTLVHLTISEIPANTGITAEYSNDNATWTGTVTLTDGLASFDLRILNYTTLYLRFNLTTTETTVTPFLNQSRIITTIGNSTGGATITTEGVNWLPIGLILGVSVTFLIAKDRL